MTIRKVCKPTAFAVFLFSTFLIGACSSDKGEEISEEAVKENTAPVGEVNVASESGGTEAPASSSSGGKGQEIYDGVCFACHAQGLAGAPKQGDKATWADRLAQGNDKLYSNAINGYTGASGSMMPAKGGRADLSDDDVKAAVDYMITAVGGTVAMAATAEPAEMAASGGVDGKAVYEASCALCHTTGVAGAPKYGDAEGWTARIAQGNDMLYEHAINGFMGKGMMPPKGGNAKLTDDEVKAAVDHMVTGSK